MKALCCAFIIFIIALASCKKSIPNNNDSSVAGNWQLVQEISSIWSAGDSALVFTPSADSSVSLILNANGNYLCQLNGFNTSEGTYSIRKDTAQNYVFADTTYQYDSYLQLNNFTTTGIFQTLTIYETGTLGQITSIFDALYMSVSNDTLTLSTGAIPSGGSSIYSFVKK